jgi:hypothetical protein
VRSKYLRPHLQLDVLSPSSLEQITHAQLAVRVAVATLWAADGRNIPAFHIFGTELPPCLQGQEFKANGLPDTVNLPPTTKDIWRVGDPLRIKLPIHGYLNLTNPPYLALTSYQSSSFDIMMGMCTTRGKIVYVFYDCAHTSQLNPKDTQYVIKTKVLDLQKKITTLRACKSWPAGTEIVPAIVTNRTVNVELRKWVLNMGGVLVDGARLATFFSPTTVLLIDNAPHGA